MTIEYQAYSDVGCVRTNNEDMILIGRDFLRDEWKDGSPEATEGFCAIVADGMGGNDGGELASDIACQEFDSWLCSLPTGLDFDQLKTLVTVFDQSTHRLINKRGRELEGFMGMGTTLVGFFVYAGQTYWLNIGDSRIYVFRNNFLRQVSVDHSLRNLYNDPTQPSNLIYNCLGSGDEYETFADFGILSLMPGDRVLICSDGLSDMLSDEQIETLLVQNAPASSLVEAAREAGGEDNISVILCDIKA